MKKPIAFVFILVLSLTYANAIGFYKLPEKKTKLFLNLYSSGIAGDDAPYVLSGYKAGILFHDKLGISFFGETAPFGVNWAWTERDVTFFNQVGIWVFYKNSINETTGFKIGIGSGYGFFDANDIAFNSSTFLFEWNIEQKISRRISIEYGVGYQKTNDYDMDSYKDGNLSAPKINLGLNYYLGRRKTAKL